MDWIIHLDTDELVHPVGAQEYSLRQLLLEVPGNVDIVIFPNYVSVHYIFLFYNLLFLLMKSFMSCSKVFFFLL